MKPLVKRNRKAPHVGGFLSELPIGIRYHAEGPTYRGVGAGGLLNLLCSLLNRCDATFMVNVQVDEVLNLTPYIKDFNFDSVESPVVEVHTDQHNKAGKEPGQKERPVTYGLTH